ncbi:MAG TPA: hypothetical protein VF529_14385 [Solirubrobacteraceae bacterium]|jgi:hypothetical protein
MTAHDFLQFLWPEFTVGGAVLGLAVWVMLMPDNAQKVAGWIWQGIASIRRRADRRAIALRVQGDVNAQSTKVMRTAPKLLSGKLKVSFRDADEARAIAERGDVVVFMRESAHHPDNVARALMAYLPKALIPRARRYLDDETMQAADLTVAKSVLTSQTESNSALDVLYDEHFEPAMRASESLCDKVHLVDHIDLHGWLLRVLLAEYKLLGDRLFPGHCDPRCVAEAEHFARWLGDLAKRPPGDTSRSLQFAGTYIRVGIVFVAQRERLESEGLTPYRKRAKRLIYRDRMDAVYLIARDANIPAVEALFPRLADDALVADAEIYRYGLRSDFRARAQLNRQRAIAACFRRKHSRDENARWQPGDHDDEATLPDEIFDVAALNTAELDPIRAAADDGDQLQERTAAGSGRFERSSPDADPEINHEDATQARATTRTDFG